uniref:Uncharacterized protein n=1 Tax=Klebsiella pneumoniae TaxID=573 RepID=A0A6M5ZZP3_KLEPN|nr:hypothetical protein [Klebsiella pneumoniae]QJX12176.1 hypothetical protein [Klebsiella pneumoniae]UMW89262.1 hypothetical protein [Klebsiella pneumoniae]URH10989.1 hypothetical protein [Klebsiella pneumoniae]
MTKISNKSNFFLIATLVLSYAHKKHTSTTVCFVITPLDK